MNKARLRTFCGNACAFSRLTRRRSHLARKFCSDCDGCGFFRLTHRRPHLFRVKRVSLYFCSDGDASLIFTLALTVDCTLREKEMSIERLMRTGTYRGEVKQKRESWNCRSFNRRSRQQQIGDTLRNKFSNNVGYGVSELGKYHDTNFSKP